MTAGIPVESLKGSRTAVFSASMLEDYMRMSAMDPDNAERTAVTGCTVACVIPNRISWYFDLQGPSIHCNTACSSSLSAVDMACKSIKSGDATCVSEEASMNHQPDVGGLLTLQVGTCHWIELTTRPINFSIIVRPEVSVSRWFVLQLRSPCERLRKRRGHHRACAQACNFRCPGW